jgi:hypothetical protein
MSTNETNNSATLEMETILKEILINAGEIPAATDPPPIVKKVRKPRAKETSPRKAYICALCGQVGHNKRTCPNRDV